MQKVTCKICHKEFATDSRIACYCSYKCKRIAKRALDRKRYAEEMAEQKARKEAFNEINTIPPKPTRTPGKNANLSINAYLPCPSTTCFFCPLVGPKCRENPLPLCKPGSGHYQEFQAAVAVQQVYG